VMNAYSQPQDPQMQINVMAWLPVAWGLFVAQVLQWTHRRAVAVALVVLSLLPLPYNVLSLAPKRGADGFWQARLGDVERASDPARTVLVYSGFESIVAWHYLIWTHRWEGVCDLGPAPMPTPKYKWISILSPAVHYPNWTPAQHAAEIKRQLDCAFDKGYRVVAADIWKMSAEDLSGQFLILSAGNRGPALHEMFNRDYSATPLTNLDGYHEIKRR
jgi:hypothetical protein